MHWKNKKVLITGGASFIGSHLAEALLNSGASVRVADDLSSGKLGNLSAIKSDIQFMEGDLRYIDFSSRASEGCDNVFHLAAEHGGRGYISTHPANCAGNMALDNIVFSTAAKNSVSHITFASSACVYPTDIQEEKQLLEETMVDFTKRGGAFADEEYGWAKLMGEMSLRAHHKQYGINATSVRLSTAYGPRENESHAIMALIAKAFIKQSPYEIWGTGEQSRGFTYVGDIVEALMLAGEHIKNGIAVNAGTSEYISLNDIANTIFHITEWSPPDGVKHLTDKPVGVMHRALDTQFAENVTGWRPTTSLNDGLRKTIDWYVKNNNVKDISARLDDILMQR